MVTLPPQHAVALAPIMVIIPTLRFRGSAGAHRQAQHSIAGGTAGALMMKHHRDNDLHCLSWSANNKGNSSRMPDATLLTQPHQRSPASLPAAHGLSCHNVPTCFRNMPTFLDEVPLRFLHLSSHSVGTIASSHNSHFSVMVGEKARGAACLCHLLLVN